MEFLVDSSVWVALFLDFDTQHEKAARAISHINGPIFTPYCVIVEVATVLAYKHSKAQADAFLGYLSENRDIALIENVIEEEIMFYRSITKNVSFTDSSLIFLAKKLDARLITFDLELARIAKSM
ncbi:MAG: hypothetical protein G01um101470_955 [Parcubacteria group bacterium Gr01-1014_70]|nr:MAG: hypothetical protein G01um101470_955 [Parcubacteria group bacterium Gr01-1014_70]